MIDEGGGDEEKLTGEALEIVTRREKAGSKVAHAKANNGNRSFGQSIRRTNILRSSDSVLILQNGTWRLLSVDDADRRNDADIGLILNFNAGRCQLMNYNNNEKIV